jgi:hypothetical protein
MHNNRVVSEYQCGVGYFLLIAVPCIPTVLVGSVCNRGNLIAKKCLFYFANNDT